MRIIIYWYWNSIRPQDSKMKSLAINVSFFIFKTFLFYIIKFYLSFVWLYLRKGSSFTVLFYILFFFCIYNNNVPPFYTRTRTRTHHDNICRFIVSSIFFIFSYKREGNLNNDKNNKIKCLYPWILGVSFFLSCL